LAISNKKSVEKARLPALAETAKSHILLWRRRAATLAMGALAAGMAYGVVFGHNGLTAFARKREEAKTLQQQMEELHAQNDRLRGHVERLQSDPSAIEHQARADLRYARNGEVIYTLAPTPEADTTKAPKAKQ
jgi:cell division protein FtsB